MKIIPQTYLDGLKRYLRRRKYQKLDGHTSKKRKLRIIRLGDHVNRRRGLKVKKQVALKEKVITPSKLVAKFHKAYINVMISLDVAIFGKKKVLARPTATTVVVSTLAGKEVVDGRMIIEVYKRMISAH
nr:Transcriptional repressor NrdR like [Ipomoea batatas]